MRPVVLTILDGWGYSPLKIGNAISNARTPNLDFIKNNFPSLLLQASGKAVGMAWGEPGNSEVGHLTIGAGRTIFQYLSRINKAIENRDFFKNDAFLKACEHIKKNNSKLHIAGLLTSGSVHAYFNHIIALIEMAKKNNITSVKLHLFTDGKDSGLKEGLPLIRKVRDHLKKNELDKTISLATVMGRDFPMDRNDNWDLTKKAYNLMTHGDGEKSDNIEKKLQEYYSQGMHDNKVPPILLDPNGLVIEGDAIIFFNFREDSMRQIIKAFIDDDIVQFFERKKIDNLLVVGMTQYLEHPDLIVAIPIPEVKNSLAEVLSLNNKTQLHVAETEKYAHVTYFFNCLNNNPFSGETDIFIKSIRHAETEPEMMANEIMEKVVEEMKKDFFDIIIVNFANADIVAHSGNLEKTVIGVEEVDRCLGKIKEAVFEKDGILIITADHGNAESLTYKGGEAETRHNLNPVPFHMVVKEYERPRSEEEIQESLSAPKGLIADIAPTVLEVFSITKPLEMTGESLFKILT